MGAGGQILEGEVALAAEDAIDIDARADGQGGDGEACGKTFQRHRESCLLPGVERERVGERAVTVLAEGHLVLAGADFAEGERRLALRHAVKQDLRAGGLAPKGERRGGGGEGGIHDPRLAIAQVQAEGALQKALRAEGDAVGPGRVEEEVAGHSAALGTVAEHNGGHISAEEHGNGGALQRDFDDRAVVRGGGDGAPLGLVARLGDAQKSGLPGGQFDLEGRVAALAHMVHV